MTKSVKKVLLEVQAAQKTDSYPSGRGGRFLRNSMLSIVGILIVCFSFEALERFRESQPLPWDNPNAIQSTITWAWDSQMIEAAPELEHVQSFQGGGYFVSKDTNIYALDLTLPGPIATISRPQSNNWAIAVAKKDHDRHYITVVKYSI